MIGISTQDVSGHQSQHGLSDAEMAACLGVTESTWRQAREGRIWANGLPKSRAERAARLLSRDEDPTIPLFAEDACPHTQATAEPVVAEEAAADPSVDQDTGAEQDAGPTDDDDSDHRALYSDVIAWLDGLPAAPSGVDIADLCDALAAAAASPAIVEEVADEVIRRWHHGATKRDQERTRNTIRTAWKDAVKKCKDRAAGDGSSQRPEDGSQEPTPEERAALRAELWPQVKDLAMRSDLLAHGVQLAQRIGVVNEEELISLVILAGTSRVTAKPINPLVKGPSGGGKTYVSQCALSVFPPEEVKAISAGSQLSLVYSNWAVKHHILVIYEATMLQQDDASMYAMLLRTLISENRICYTKTIEDPEEENGHRTVDIVKEGPVMCLITTTADTIHPEQETRMLSINVHESAAQTRAVMDAIARAAERDVDDTTEEIPGLEEYRNLQRWIATGPRTVVVPFAPALVSALAAVAVRMRRDTSAILSMIKAHALLCQAQRETTPAGSVIATLDDYEAVRPVLATLLSVVIGDAPSERVVSVVQCVEAIVEAAANSEKRQGARTAFHSRADTGRSPEPQVSKSVVTISLGWLARKIGVDRAAIQRAVSSAVDSGYLTRHDKPTTATRGQPHQLSIGPRRLGSSAVETVPTKEMLGELWAESDALRG